MDTTPSINHLSKFKPQELYDLFGHECTSYFLKNGSSFYFDNGIAYYNSQNIDEDVNFSLFESRPATTEEVIEFHNGQISKMKKKDFNKNILVVTVNFFNLYSKKVTVAKHMIDMSQVVATRTHIGRKPIHIESKPINGSSVKQYPVTEEEVYATKVSANMPEKMDNTMIEDLQDLVQTANTPNGPGPKIVGRIDLDEAFAETQNLVDQLTQELTNDIKI